MRVGGTLIDLIAIMFNLSPLEAAKQLVTEYGITIDEQIPNRGERTQLQIDRGLVQGLEKWCTGAGKILASLWRRMGDDMAQYAPATPNDLDNIHSRFVAACHLRDYVNCLLESLQDADFDGKIEFYKQLESEVSMFADYYRKCIEHEESVKSRPAKQIAG